ncbi:MAG: glutaminyl-peptide cyclotransferase [Bacteroidota bacterium]
MNSTKTHSLFIVCLSICFLCFFSCTETDDSKDIYSLHIRGNTSLVKSGSSVQCTYRTQKKTHLDSIAIIYDGSKTQTIADPDTVFLYPIPDSVVGRKSITIKFYSDRKMEMHTKHITIVSDIRVKPKKASITNMYNHDSEAYTQGLEWHNGVFYESTGQYGFSSVRKVDPETGNVLIIKNLPETVFGEGLTRVGDSIIQITWKSQIGYIYRADNLNKIGEFSYATEGWGLCNDGTYLYMSDGSEYIHVYSLPNITKIKQFPVYDHIGAVSFLNELEFINGHIFANIYQTDEIVEIDPRTGKVLRRFDLSGILPDNFKHRNIDVLNGIAYDSENNRIFVTGKNWPKLFEISL